MTDALVVLGYIDADNFLGGDMRLDREGAVRACKALGEPLGLDAEAAAWGIREIALAEMTKAVRTRLALRGLDPREHALVSFGGCASLFTADIARAVSAPRVIVPAAASVLSALGAATMGMRRERVRSLLTPLPVDVAELAAIGEELRSQVGADLAADGVSEADCSVSLEADLRFLRQNWELTIPLDTIPFDDSFTGVLRQRFEDDYSRLYGAGSITLGTPVEMVSIRAVGRGPAAQSWRNARGDETDDAPEIIHPKRERRVRSGADADMSQEVAILDETLLGPGQAVRGPALLERWDTSIWVPEGALARRGAMGSILLEVT